VENEFRLSLEFAIEVLNAKSRQRENKSIGASQESGKSSSSPQTKNPKRSRRDSK
jgi:hypothetical protein